MAFDHPSAEYGLSIDDGSVRAEWGIMVSSARQRAVRFAVLTAPRAGRAVLDLVAGSCMELHPDCN